jgi:hypothetical protein
MSIALIALLRTLPNYRLTPLLLVTLERVLDNPSTPSA